MNERNAKKEKKNKNKSSHTKNSLRTWNYKHSKAKILPNTIHHQIKSIETKYWNYAEMHSASWRQSGWNVRYSNTHTHTSNAKDTRICLLSVHYYVLKSRCVAANLPLTVKIQCLRCACNAPRNRWHHRRWGGWWSRPTTVYAKQKHHNLKSFVWEREFIIEIVNGKYYPCIVFPSIYFICGRKMHTQYHSEMKWWYVYPTPSTVAWVDRVVDVAAAAIP